VAEGMSALVKPGMKETEKEGDRGEEEEQV
jgi:hypothetical protein